MTEDVRNDLNSERPLGQALWRGFRCRCPRCGDGPIFSRFLKVAPSCTVCGQSFEGQRADDLPPYITIFIVGHLVVGLMLSSEMFADWPTSWHLILWPSLTIALTMLLIQRVKGAVVALQWALRMHGFDPDGDVHETGIGPRAEAGSRPTFAPRKLGA